MNESITDEKLRTFRLPIMTRLRMRIDELRELNLQAAAYIRKQSERIDQLERDLRKANNNLTKANRELAQIERAKLRIGKGVDASQSH